MPKGVHRDISVQHAILHRLKICRGHLDKVIEMVKNGDYCIDVIHQSMAVQSAIKQADREILKHHLETCVTEEVRNGKADKVIAELVKVVEKR